MKRSLETSQQEQKSLCAWYICFESPCRGLEIKCEGSAAVDCANVAAILTLHHILGRHCLSCRSVPRLAEYTDEHLHFPLKSKREIKDCREAAGARVHLMHRAD